jgi:hypothetical protein
VKKPSVEADVIQRTIVKSAYDQAKSFEMNAHVSASGWGASMKASMQHSSNQKLSVKEVTFVASRKIEYGYEGWELPPPIEALP